MFTDAQQMHKDDSDFYAPDLDEVQAKLLPGDNIKVCETDDGGENGERYWVKVTLIDWPAIYGKVNNELICWDRALHSKIMVESVNVYDVEYQTRYIGTETDETTPNVGEVEVYCDDGRRLPLNPRYDLRNHSPDGFAWGYSGSGPAQLALAILAHATDDEEAQKRYQKYKETIIAREIQGNWVISARDVKEWLKKERGC